MNLNTVLESMNGTGLAALQVALNKARQETSGNFSQFSELIRAVEAAGIANCGQSEYSQELLVAFGIRPAKDQRPTITIDGDEVDHKYFDTFIWENFRAGDTVHIDHHELPDAEAVIYALLAIANELKRMNDAQEEQLAHEERVADMKATRELYSH